MVGDRIPKIILPVVTSQSTIPVNLADYLQGKTTLLIGHPGAFTSITTNFQIPDYREAKIPHQTIFWSVNDPFVIRKYIEKHKIEFPMLSDYNGELTRTLEVGLPEEEYFSFICRRVICLLKDDLILGVSLETDVMYTNLTSPQMAKHLSKVVFNY